MFRDKVLYATGMFQVGDTFWDEEGNLHTVTDVLVCHYIRRETYKVLYEVDNSGEFIPLRLPIEAEINEQPEKPTTKKSPLKLTPKAPKNDIKN